MKKLLSKFRIVVPVLVCVFAFTTLLLTGCKEEPPHIHRLEQVEGKVATCTETGKMKHYHCTLCDKNYLTEEAKEEVSEEDLIIAVDEDNHNYDFTTADYDFHLKAGSETDYECTATVSCSRNAEHTKITETVNATVQVTEPDCTTAGEKVYTAEFTNKAFGKDGVFSKTESINAPGHNMSHTTRVEATCVNPGNIEYWHCSSCNKNYSDANGQTEVSAEDLIIAKLDHNMSHTTRVEATCVNPGNIEYWHCSSCNKNYSDANGQTEVSAENLEIAVNSDNHNYNYVYDYTNSRYVAECTRCNHTDSAQIKTAGVKGYPYLVNNENTLLSAVEKGGYIKLADNITINGVIIISKNVNIDLNEKTISYTQTQADNNDVPGVRRNYCIFNLTGGSSVVSNGNITYNVNTEEEISQGRVISIENDAQLVMQGLTITSALRGVMVFDNSQTTIQNCEITSSQDTISGNNVWGPTSRTLIVNIQNSTIKSNNLTAVFVPSYMTLNIENSHITGNTSAIYAMMGVIKVDATSTLSSTRKTFVARQDAPVSAEDNSNQLTNSGPGDESYDGATIVLRTNYYYDSNANTNELTLNISDWSKVTAVSGVKAVVYNFAEDSSYIAEARKAGNPITNQFAEVCNKLAEKDGVKYFLYTEGATEGQKGLVEEYVCKDSGNNFYTSFESLISELSGNTTITLLKDITLQEKLSISPLERWNIVLNLGGHTIYGAMTSGSMIHVKGCNLTITNGNIVSENPGVGVIRVQGREGEDSASTMTDPVKVNTKLVLTDTLNVTSKASYCLFIFGSGADVETSADLTNIGEGDSVFAVISTNGNSGSEIGSLTIKGGTITHKTDVALYLPAAGIYNIEGGTIIGSSAVYIKCGTLTIKGGTLKATAKKADFAHNGNGCHYTGDALVIEACNYPGGNPTANIYGGTFIIADEKAKQIGVYNYDGNKAVINKNPDIVITTEEKSSQA